MALRQRTSMYNLHFTPSFNRDVSQAINYITDTLKAPKAAQNHINELDRKLAQLKESPLLHRTVRNDYLASLGYRSVMVKKYYVFFTVVEDSNTVNLVRFIHSRRNWPDILGNAELNSWCQAPFSFI
jgi:addiction module RelE/StbE family toxin